MPRRTLKAATALGVIGLPAITILLLVHVYLGSSLRQFRPFASDELVNWHSVATFARVGLEGGYYVYNETPAPAGNLIHFGAWGPAYPVIVGMLARVVGWHYTTPMWFNLALVSLGLGLLIALSRPDQRQLLALFALVLTFWPIPLFLATAQQEAIHYALACGLAAGFHLLLTRADRPPWLKIGVLAAILIGAFFRFTWGLLLFPYFWLALKPTRPSRIIAAVALATALLAAAVLQWRYLSAPFPYAISAVIHGSLLSWRTLRTLLGLVYFNLSNLGRGALIEIVQRGLIVGLGLLMAVRIGQQWRAARGDAPPGVPSWVERMRGVDRDRWLQVFNLGGYFAASLTHVIRPQVDYRILAPHLLFSLLLLVLSRRFRLLAGVVVVQCLMFAGFLLFFRDWRGGGAFAPDFEAHIRFQQATEGLLVYQAGADPWCNTVLMEEYPPEIVVIQPGLGFGTFQGVPPDQLAFPLRSRYLLVPPATAAILRDHASLELLAATSAGELYLNLDADCPGP